MITNALGQRLLQGDGSWPYTVTIEDEDLTLHDGNIVTRAKFAVVVATFWGGTAAQDPQDNGETASGLSTRNNPALIGCALAMSRSGSPATDGSPVPRMPYIQTIVEVCNLASGKRLGCPLVDLGPAKSATTRPDQVHGIDLTRGAFLELGGDLEQGWMHVAWRIAGAARYTAIPLVEKWKQ